MRWPALAGALLAITLPGPGEIAAAQAGTNASSETSRPRGGLRRFRSDAELRAYLTRDEEGSRVAEVLPIVSPSPPPAPSAEPSADAEVFDSVGADIVMTGSRVPDPSITNTQEAGVDEGGIVKVQGDTLVILRRGRLFTVSLAGGELRPIDSINAFPPGVSGRGDWYDEMLVTGNRVIVVGYSYDRGGTEINRFRLSPEGRLSFEDAYHLRSNDYYSSRNYASRLIGHRLIIYTPLDLDWDEDPLEILPGVRRWRGDNSEAPFQRIAGARQIYKPPPSQRERDIEIDTLHTVMDCDVAAPALDCSAIGVLGPESHTFYVSGSAVYLWTSDEWYDDDGDTEGVAAFMYRLPLDRRRPAAIRVRGAPVDQFSFREDLGDGLVNVVVRSEGDGDSMLGPEASEGSVALLRLPIREFGNGSREARLSFYRSLPKIDESEWSFRNRYVGDHLLYGGGEYDEERNGASLVVVPLDGGAVEEIELAHSVDRIELLGRDGLVVGGGSNTLGFTAIELDGRRPRIGDLFRLPEASEGESRSHAFFFNPETADGASGILGLPIARAVESNQDRLFGSAAAMLFLSRQNRRFAPAGELAADVRGVIDDGCQASCVDWYGNARPIFWRGRIFALLGYELVEGRLDGRTIHERRRVSFAPPPPPPAKDD
jgi:hypothetical protein